MMGQLSPAVRDNNNNTTAKVTAVAVQSFQDTHRNTIHHTNRIVSGSHIFFPDAQRANSLYFHCVAGSKWMNQSTPRCTMKKSRRKKRSKKRDAVNKHKIHPASLCTVDPAFKGSTLSPRGWMELWAVRELTLPDIYSCTSRTSISSYTHVSPRYDNPSTDRCYHHTKTGSIHHPMWDLQYVYVY